MKTRLYLVIVSLFVAACSPYEQVDPETGIPILPVPGQYRPQDPPTQPATPGMVRPALSVASCGDVANALKAQAIAQAIDQTQAAFESAWRQHEQCNDDWWGGYNSMNLPSADGGVAMPSPQTGSDKSEPDGHSETNNQVAGVDEADFVKTDGKHIYLISGGVFRILSSWPADQTQQIAQVKLAGTPKKLFVLGDRALIYSSVYKAPSYDPNDPYNYGGAPYYDGGYNNECTYGYDCVPTGDGNPTQITVLDISDRSAPKVVRQLELSSSLLAARRIGNAVFSVLTEATSNPGAAVSSWPNNLDICNSTEFEIYAAFKALLADNLKQIAATKVEAMFPSAKDTVGGATVNPDPFAACAGFYQSSIKDGSQLTSILSLKIDDESPAKAVTILSPPGIVYASQDALLLAVQRQRYTNWQWGWYEDFDADEATTLHRFGLDNASAAASYQASGLVKGRLLNQFALDEHAGHLRVASTTGHVGRSNADAHNTISVLAQKGDQLLLTGQVDQLAPTEDIRSVRFDGERGYVVTFKKTDPLYVLDLADPTAPKVLGELKIPGFSTYMHKMDDNHLLTVGYDADDQGSFAWFTGVMLQIFDVTVPTQPKLKFKHVIGTRGSSSEALTNHLAFTYYAPKDLLAMPMTVCEDSGSGGSYGGSYGDQMTFSGLMLFDVTVEGGFTMRGQVPHPMPDYFGCSNWWTQASSQVKRSIIIDNYVYSISDTLLKVNSLDDLATDLVQLPIGN